MRVTLTFHADEGAPLRRRDRSAAGRLRAGRIVVRDDRRGAGARSRTSRRERRRDERLAAWWQRGGFDHVERHDDRVQLFATRLSEGRHEFTYVVRATTAGTFRTAPARAEEMYEPEVFGRTATAIDRGASGDDAARCRCRGSARRGVDARGVAAVVAVLLCRGSACGCGSARSPAGLLDDRAATSTVVVDRHGVPLYEALSGDGTRSIAARRPTRCRRRSSRRRSRPRTGGSGRIPASIRSRSRARCRRNLAEARVVEGGSTITQQVAKLLLNRARPGRDRAAWRAKVREAVLALRLEHRFDKREILALYLNLAPYGNQIVGAERASRAYFGALRVDADAGAGGVSRRPAAASVRLQPVPQSRRPRIARQQRVLRRMQALGALDRRAGCGRRAAERLVVRADAVAVPRAALRRDGAGRATASTGRRGSRRRSTPSCRPTSPASSTANARRSIATAPHNVAVVVLDNAHRRVAGVGRIGRLLRRRARRRDQRRARRRGSPARR